MIFAFILKSWKMMIDTWICMYSHESEYFLLVTSCIYVFIWKPQIDDKYVFATIIICKLFQSINQLVLRADAADIDHKSGCPQWSECCTEYGYCHPKVSCVPWIYQCDWSHYWKHFHYIYKNNR